jgi:hypothetical protein
MIGYIIAGALLANGLVRSAVRDGVKSDEQRYREILQEIRQPMSVGEGLFMGAVCLGALAFGVLVVITLIGGLFK